MAEAGILGEDDRVELLAGEILDVLRPSRREQACVDRLAALLIPAVGPEAIVRVRGPIRLSYESEPEPDIVLLRRRSDFYSDRDAAPEDVLLLIEVADTALAYDRDVKLPLYAQAGIAEVWIVDLNGQRILVHREPGADGYGNVVEFRGSDLLSPLAFPDLRLTGEQILA